MPLGWNCEAYHLGAIFWGQIFYATGSFGIEPIIMPFSQYVLERLTLGVSQVTPCRSHRLDSLLTAPIEYIAPGEVLDGFLNPKVDNFNVQNMPTYLWFRKVT